MESTVYLKNEWNLTYTLFHWEYIEGSTLRAVHAYYASCIISNTTTMAQMIHNYLTYFTKAIRLHFPTSDYDIDSDTFVLKYTAIKTSTAILGLWSNLSVTHSAYVVPK